MSSDNRVVSFFLSKSDAFSFIFWPDLSTRTSHTLWSRSSNSGHPFLVLIWKKSLEMLTTEYDVSCSLFIYEVHHVRFCLLHLICWGFLSWTNLNYVTYLWQLLRWWFFLSFYWCVASHLLFAYVRSSWHPRGQSSYCGLRPFSCASDFGFYTVSLRTL